MKTTRTLGWISLSVVLLLTACNAQGPGGSSSSSSSSGSSALSAVQSQSSDASKESESSESSLEAQSSEGYDASSPADKSDDITVLQPQENATVTSPLTVIGDAKGFWYFEGQFPVKLLDAQGKEIATGIAKALSDWQTEQFVPFSATLEFTTTETTGTLLLQKDNPSGLPANDARISIPVRF